MGLGIDPLELDELDLSEDQHEAIERLAAGLSRERRSSRKAERSLRQELRALWQAYPPVLSGIEAKLDELFALRARAAKREAALRLEVLARLTEPQRARLRELERRGDSRAPLEPPLPPEPPDAPSGD